MSVDEVLASSLWAWPDPLVKRNQAGQVIFVNAAFLQIYGGQAQEWNGRIVDGWPAPVYTGAQRFETRSGTGETQHVFDWVESPLADGNALCIARNVTVFTTQSAPAPAPVAAPTQKPAPQPAKQSQIAEVAPAATPAPQPAPAPVQEAQKKPSQEASSEYEQTLDKKADEFAYEDNRTTSAQSDQAQPAKPQDAPIADQMAVQTPAPVTAQDPVQAPVQTPVQAQTATAPNAQEEQDRMIERRALPIKDSTSVLGSNWRDQVIAKAVGGPEAEEVAAAMGTPAPAEPVEQEPAKPAEGLQILLAEDNAINALLTRTLLEAEGAEVDTVEDGALALEAVGKKKYDLVFMDMRMPNMDGLESTRKIRAYGFTRPIIALTANAFDDDRNACFDSGMNDFMTKPVSAEELSEMVNNWAGDEAKQKIAS